MKTGQPEAACVELVGLGCALPAALASEQHLGGTHSSRRRAVGAGVAAAPAPALPSSRSFLSALLSCSGSCKRGKSTLLLRAPGASPRSPVPAELCAVSPKGPPSCCSAAWGLVSMGPPPWG